MRGNSPVQPDPVVLHNVRSCPALSYLHLSNDDGNELLVRVDIHMCVCACVHTVSDIGLGGRIMYSAGSIIGMRIKGGTNRSDDLSSISPRAPRSMANLGGALFGAAVHYTRAPVRSFVRASERANDREKYQYQRRQQQTFSLRRDLQVSASR